MLRALFLNAAEGRVRAGWRLLVGLVAFVLVNVATVFVSIAATVLPLIQTPTQLTAPLLAVIGPAQLVLTAAAVVGLGYVLDRRRPRDFGFRFDRGWWLDLGFGLALGAALQTAIFLLELGVGWLRVTGYAVTADPGASFALWFGAAVVGYVAVGIYEELFVRGYVLTNLAEGLDGLGPVGGLGPVSTRTAVGLAVLLSSSLFGLLHAANPSATLVSTGTLVFAGVFLAAGYVLTGELAIPIGIHVTWNFFQGIVWGFPVSGANLGVSLVGVEQTGPRAITGGAFGPEAGLVGVVAMAVGIVAIAAWVRSRGGDLAVAEGLTVPEFRE
ncbi:MAG: type II CAAX prenyl endopeptidase Rce1 family protein [Haloferacaceae archaeon]